jgi:hypothetical protein
MPDGHYIEYRLHFAVWYNSHHAFPIGCCPSHRSLSDGVGMCVKPRNGGRIIRESNLVSSSQSRSGFLQRTVGPLRRRSLERQTIKGRHPNRDFAAPAGSLRRAWNGPDEIPRPLHCHAERLSRSCDHSSRLRRTSMYDWRNAGDRCGQSARRSEGTRELRARFTVSNTAA